MAAIAADQVAAAHLVLGTVHAHRRSDALAILLEPDELMAPANHDAALGHPLDQESGSACFSSTTTGTRASPSSAASIKPLGPAPASSS